tara:strand:+ start:142 stop:573 length:432 start_codon:yes stop_codon:yes gene_type:complete
VALLGGGTGGGPIGVANSFTGPSQSIELVGDHFYVYTGDVSIAGDTNVHSMAEFTTGNYYCVGEVSLEGSYSSVGNGVVGLQIKLNDSVIIKTLASFAGDHTIFDTPMPIIIPSNTKVEVGALQNSGSPLDFQLMITGRIYRD